jgi:hypothetical protein
MKFSWNYLFEFLHHLPVHNANHSAVVGYFTTVLLDLYKEAESGKFFCLTPKYGKFFEIKSNFEGLELCLRFDQRGAREEFSKAYGKDPISIIGSFDRVEIFPKAA